MNPAFDRTRRATYAVLVATVFSLAPLTAHALSASEDIAITATTFTKLSKKVLPGVVSIEVNRKIAQPSGGRGFNFFGQPRSQKEMEDMFRRFFGDQMNPQNAPEEQEQPNFFESRSAGSGFFVSVEGSKGYVLTNAHVISGASNGDVKIILDVTHDDEEIAGDRVKIVERDTMGDIAILEVDLGKTAVTSLEWGDSDQLEVGEWVLALGNPLELRNSVADGIISAKHREINKSAIEDLLQTTAAINPGNSGGPLVNLEGKVIGINNAIATRTGLWQGVGFAIPSNYARLIAEQVIQGGKIRRGYLGIEMSVLTDNVSKYYGQDKPSGVIIGRVHPGTAADKAGIKRYDLITQVDGRPIKDIGALLRSIATREVDSKVKLTVLRFEPGDTVDIKEVALTATLGERPSDDELEAMRSGEAPGGTPKNLGMEFNKRSKPQDSGLGTQVDPSDDGSVGGLVLSGVAKGTAADKAGLIEGDILVEINRQAVASQADLNKALETKPKNRDQHLILFHRPSPTGGSAVGFTTMDADKK